MLAGDMNSARNRCRVEKRAGLANSAIKEGIELKDVLQLSPRVLAKNMSSTKNRCRVGKRFTVESPNASRGSKFSNERGSRTERSPPIQSPNANI